MLSCALGQQVKGSSCHHGGHAKSRNTGAPSSADEFCLCPRLYLSQVPRHFASFRTNRHTTSRPLRPAGFSAVGAAEFPVTYEECHPSLEIKQRCSTSCVIFYKRRAGMTLHCNNLRRCFLYGPIISVLHCRISLPGNKLNLGNNWKSPPLH